MDVNHQKKSVKNDTDYEYSNKERWLRGLKRWFAKSKYCNKYRGFESHFFQILKIIINICLLF